MRAEATSTPRLHICIQLTAVQYANGTSLTVSYDQAHGWPTELNWGAAADYHLSYDNGQAGVGLLTGVTENGASSTFLYDALYRLTFEQRTGSGAYTHSYSFDLAGNRRSIDNGPQGQYDAANKHTYIPGGSASYDGDGDLTSLSGVGSFTWDPFSQLTGFGGYTFGYL